MKKLIKSIEVDDGLIYAVINSERSILTNSDIMVQIYESETEEELIKGHKTRIIDYDVCILLCNNQSKISKKQLKLIDQFDISFNIKGDTKMFKNVIPKTINLNGSWEFDINNSRELIEELKREGLL